MKKLIIAPILLLILSCVSKTEYDNLLNEKENLQSEIIDLNTRLEAQSSSLAIYQKEIYNLREEKRQADVRKSQVKYITEDEARGYVKDYYEFYEADQLFRNVQIRRVADNKFKVSLESVTRKANFSKDDFFWKAWVYNLTVNNNGTYDFNMTM